jgi:hypothetical protein
MKKLSQKKIESIIGQLYWKAHTDGVLRGEKGKPNFGRAAIVIESVVTEFLTEKEIQRRVKKTNKENYGRK